MDLVRVVEAMYRLDLPDAAWLGLLAEELAPLLDVDRQGQVAMTVLCPDPTAFSPTAAVETNVPEAVSAVFREGVASLPPRYVAGGVLARSWGSCATIDDWDRIPPVRDGSAGAVGICDMWGLSAVELDGRGCWFAGLIGRRRDFPAGFSEKLVVLTRHLQDAHRVRCRVNDGVSLLEGGAAVFDPSGRARHARSSTRPEELQRLSAGVRAAEQARSRRGRADSLRALEAWKASVGPDWILVDSFERDGTRFVVAMESRVEAPGFELLSVREREVLRHAQLGHHNKAIAYDLGLSPSTVRVLLARAAAKVGARSRQELLELATRGSAARAREET